MSEELKTAEKNEEEVTSPVGGNADTDQQQQPSPETENEVEFTDTTEEQGAEAENPAQPPKKEEKAQTREQNNSENARRRREAERQKELKAAREQAIIETLGGKNPYTNEEMTDSADVEEYLAMKEIEKQGGDPLADFSKFQKRKEKEKLAEETKKKESDEWYRKDYEAFVEKHPEADINALLADPQFQLFASGKVGTLPLAEIYEGYTELIAEFDKRSKQKAKQILANRKASPGALSSPNANNEGLFSVEQVRAMTPEEVKKNFDKIRASMRKW